MGGRAWAFTFYPLVYKEIPHFDLLKALNQGLLPSHYLSHYPAHDLRAYINVYLKENDGQIAIEIKISPNPQLSDLSGLSAFCDDYQPQHALVICQAPKKEDYKLKTAFILISCHGKNF